jgi:hypothetical protein
MLRAQHVLSPGMTRGHLTGCSKSWGLHTASMIGNERFLMGIPTSDISAQQKMDSYNHE